MERQSSVAFCGIDSATPVNEPLSAKYTRSFAYHTVKERLPVILTTIVDHLVRNKESITKCNELAESDLKNCIGRISKLKNELQTNKKFTNICSKGEDGDRWNKSISLQRENSNSDSWFESTWLFAECYMYRRVREIFENSDTLNNMDYFYYHKAEAYSKSLAGIEILGKFTEEVIARRDNSAEEETFLKLMKASLWGNRCDLSISAGSPNSDRQHHLNYITALDSSLLHDDSVPAYNLLVDSRSTGLVIDVVMDNAGYELFCDLCFCDFLCAVSLASKVRLHVKKFPWYVSDTTISDVRWLLERMKENGLEDLSNRWSGYFADGTWTVEDEGFWTLPLAFEEMEDEDVSLYNNLCRSHLIIFKGDLNYRKILRDINWNFSESFDVVLKRFRPTNILTLRTIKSDIVCGLKPEKYENLPPDLEWMRTGEKATIQLWQKKSQR